MNDVAREVRIWNRNFHVRFHRFDVCSLVGQLWDAPVAPVTCAGIVASAADARHLPKPRRLQASGNLSIEALDAAQYLTAWAVAAVWDMGVCRPTTSYVTYQEYHLPLTNRSWKLRLSERRLGANVQKVRLGRHRRLGEGARGEQQQAKGGKHADAVPHLLVAYSV